MNIHIVEKGDVLWQIADYYEVDINIIIEMNGITNSNLLLEGQSLLIPSPGVLYTVKYGDTLWHIAQRFGVPLIDLLSLNNIVNPNIIYPGVVLTIPQEPRPAFEVNAFTYVFGENDITRLSNYIDYLTYLSPFSYIVREDGRLTQINDETAIQFALSNNVIPIMSLVNFTLSNGGDVTAHNILNNMDLMTTLIDNILYTMREKGYRGLNATFNISPVDNEAYNNFMQMLTSMLHQEGYFVSTTVTPYYADHGEVLYDGYDLESLGNILDYIIFLVNDWSDVDPELRAINPITEIRRMLDYAVSVIPRDKILMGYEIYARDWVLPHSEGLQPETISVQVAMNRATRSRAKIEYDDRSQAPFYFYRDTQGRMHVVWFEDARSAQAKFDIVKEYGIRGMSYWSLEYLFTQNWHLLQDNFIIVKD